MKHTLATELKNAGFPQVLRRSLPFASSDGSGFSDSRVHQDDIVMPNLDELIEACGDIHFGLEHAGLGWIASKHDIQPLNTVSTAHCSSPTEAVARLWLALNTTTTT